MSRMLVASLCALTLGSSLSGCRNPVKRPPLACAWFAVPMSQFPQGYSSTYERALRGDRIQLMAAEAETMQDAGLVPPVPHSPTAPAPPSETPRIPLRMNPPEQPLESKENLPPAPVPVPPASRPSPREWLDSAWKTSP